MIKQVNKAFDSLLSILIYVSLGIIILASMTSIILRWCEISLLWIDPLVRHLVFVLTFFGGAVALGDNQHIKIDLVNNFLEKKNKTQIKKWVELAQSLVVLVGLLVLFYASYQFLLVEIEYGKEEFLGLHSSTLIGILPFGFTLMVLKCLLLLGEQLLNLRRAQ